MATRPRLRSVPPVPAPAPQSMQSPMDWVWDGASWTCGDNPSPPGCPPAPGCEPPCPPPLCPPTGWPVPCPPFYPPPSNQPPWYPGANGGVSFSQTAPPCPIRGAFWYDGNILWMYDGAAWVDVGVKGISTLTAGGAPVFIGPTAPPASKPGALWWDGTELQLWDGTKWNLIGPTPAPATPTNSGLLGIMYFGTSQQITIPPGATKCYIQMWGASGGSGGGTDANTSGSGAGGYLEKLLTGLVPGNTMQFTCGAGGTAGPVAANGGPGGVTTMTSGSQQIPQLICNPGDPSVGFVGSGNEGDRGANGGTATGGDINVTGQSGSDGGVGIGAGSGGQNFFSRGADGIGTQGPASQVGNPGFPGGLKVSWFS